MMTEVAHTRQRQLQRARDRRRRQGQHVHVAAHLLQPFLVGNAELLFLVDHQKTQVLKFGSLGQQGMGADDDICGALGHLIARVGGILGRYKTR